MEDRLLSKIIDTEDIQSIRGGSLSPSDFYSQQEAYLFIKEYIQTYGETPEAETVARECTTFNYVPSVPDKLDYLISEVKNATAKRKAYELLQQQAGVQFSKLKGRDFVEWLSEQANTLKEAFSTVEANAVNYATNGQERASQYLNYKENKDSIFIPTPFSTLNNWLGGGAELGDYILLHAYTNRGKSWIASQFGLTAWKNGNGVLYYSPELTLKQQQDRFDTLNGHFTNKELKSGSLSGNNEARYLQYLDGFNSTTNETPLLVKTMGELPKGLDLSVIEGDLLRNPTVKFVVIDGFNLISHGTAKGQSNRDSMGNTSRKLRQLFARHKVVGLVVAQTPTSAEKENKVADDEGQRMVKCPELHQYSETVALIQDPSVILTFDAVDGVGGLKLVKSRTPYVGSQLELHTDFNAGYITETTTVDYF
ncbi:DnaB-like helicase C-terminal domain-containing protein [Clostridium felsineum]|uniref:DnaB-like helicase C-terminal domain-containing protein n=1 Tax=Clostridium felsineum TaxID=36839 RepID=UPI00098C760C|nr:DnaB-like helicase C-terminal domain-containing protein [Clostridium felsineum]URZ16916.1 hypothetical protein CLFE_029630 [Clostridium felsineum DSM 794]